MATPSVKYRAPPPPSSSSLTTVTGSNDSQVFPSTPTTAAIKNNNNNGDSTDEAPPPSPPSTPAAIKPVTPDADLHRHDDSNHGNGVAVVEKPVVENVKLLSRGSSMLMTPVTRSSTGWRSDDSIDWRLRRATPTQSVTPTIASSVNRTSSFLPPSDDVINKQDGGGGDDDDDRKQTKDEDIYSLPGQCYSDDTLKAVKLITDKYDTVKRTQMRAISFRGAISQTVPDSADVTDEVVSSADGTEAVGSVADQQQSSSQNDCNPVVNGVTNSTSPSDDIVLNASVDCSRDASGLTSQLQVLHDNDNDVIVRPTTPTSGLSRDIMSLSRYRLDHVTMSSTDDLLAASGADAAPPPGDDGVSRDQDGGVGGGCAVSNIERLRVEMFYRSLETLVYVCTSTADLCLATVPPTNAASAVPPSDWTSLLGGGVPVWVLNCSTPRRTSSSRSHPRRRRELLLVLADKQTGLPLWTDRFNHLSQLTFELSATEAADASQEMGTECGPTGDELFMRLSTSPSQLVRLRFNRPRLGARLFVERFKQLTSDPSDPLWMLSAQTRRHSDVGDGSFLTLMLSCTRSRRRRRRRQVVVTKASISQPCNVVHVCQLTATSRALSEALKHLVVADSNITADRSHVTDDDDDDGGEGTATKADVDRITSTSDSNCVNETESTVMTVADSVETNSSNDNNTS